MIGKIFIRIREVYDWTERAHFWPTVWGALKEAYGWITGGGLIMTVAAALAGWSYFAIFCACLLGLAIVMLFVMTMRVLHLSKRTAIPAAPSGLFAVTIEATARRLGDFPVVCAMTLTNVSGQSQDVLVKIEQFAGAMPDNMPRPFVLRTENQILEPRSGPFRLRPNETKTIPLLYRDPVRAVDWSFLDEHGRRHATPASPFKMLIGVYCDNGSRKYEIVCDTDASWKPHSPTIIAIGNDHVLTDDWGYLR